MWPPRELPTALPVSSAYLQQVGAGLRRLLSDGRFREWDPWRCVVVTALLVEASTSDGSRWAGAAGIARHLDSDVDTVVSTLQQAAEDSPEAVRRTQGSGPTMFAPPDFDPPCSIHAARIVRVGQAAMEPLRWRRLHDFDALQTLAAVTLTAVSAAMDGFVWIPAFQVAPHLGMQVRDIEELLVTMGASGRILRLPDDPLVFATGIPDGPWDRL